MFARIYTYRLRILTRNYQLLWWTLLFPLLLSTIMYIALGNIDQAIEFRAIPVAIVDDAAWQGDANFRQVIESVSEKTDGSLTAGEPDSKLLAPQSSSRRSRSVAALTTRSGTRSRAPKTSSAQRYGSSILKLRPVHTNQRRHRPNRPARPAALPAAVADRLCAAIPGTRRSVSQPDTIVSFFYAVAGRLYGGFWGLREVNEIRLISPRPAHASPPPLSKMSVFIAQPSPA